MQLKFAVLALVVCGAWAMTDEEAKQFHNSGQYGGRVSITDNGDSHTLSSDGLPDHPIVMVNPNRPVSMNDVYTLPKEPTVTDKPGCLSLGPIGVAITGALIFDPLDADGENAVEGSGAERFDQYGGHTAPGGQYHYHKIPGTFMYNGEADKLLGVALDGFPIYGPMASDLGRNVKNSDLDECHGRYVNGKYRYHVNDEFPYYLACFRGSTVSKAHTVYGNCDSKTTYRTYGHACICADRNQGGNHMGPGGMHQQGGQQGYPTNQQGSQQGHPINQQGSQQGHPINQQGNQQGYPINQQGNQQGYPISQQGAQEGSTINQQGSQQGYPINQQGNQQGYPINQQGNQQPMNPQQGGMPPMDAHHHFRPPMDPNHQGYPFGYLGPHRYPPQNPDGTIFGKK